jgi:lipopolysaccharide heptosyltransferase II
LNILVVKLGALGDVVNTLPLVINLKTRLGATVHWVVEPLSYPLVSRHRFVDHAILFDKFRWRSSLKDVLHRLRAVRFDLALDLQRILKSGFFTLGANCQRRVGFDRRRCKELTGLFPFERIPPADPQAHMLDQYLEFATYLGLEKCQIRWEIPAGSKVPIDLPPNFVVLNIGATKPANRWVPERFALLAEKLSKTYQLKTVLTGGVEDRPRAQQITVRKVDGMTDLVGKTSLAELIEVLRASRLVVSCDTGPMHLAVALHKPVVALFGPANPMRTGPYRGHVIQPDLDCIACGLRRCNTRDCMKAITVDDVLHGVEKLLAGNSPNQK